jgi:hypothetical protein
MAVIGNSSTQQAFTPAIDYFSGNGSTTAFTLSRPVASVAQVQVVIDNVAQNPSSAYTVSSNTITFTSAPLSGTNNIYVYYTSPITQVIAPGQGTVGLTALSATGTASSSTYLRGDNTWATVASPSAATPTVLGTVYGKQTATGASPYLTAYGYNAGSSVTSAGGVTAIGFEAASSVVSGSTVGTTAVGYQALKSATDTNTGLGYQAGFSTTTQYNGTFIGYQAGYSNVANNNTAVGFETFRGGTLSQNVAVGCQALYTGGNNDNVAIGFQALYTEGNTGNGQNVAIGSGASKITTSSAYNNVLIGYRSGYVATTTNGATCVGATAGRTLTTGGSITCVGSDAGAGITTGGSGTYIGASTAASSGGAANEVVLGAGNGPTGKGSSTAFINANGGGTYNGANSSSWATTSDRRLKKNIVDNTEGLDKIVQIRVCNFEYRTEDEVTELPKHTVIDKQGVQLGVIAQELREVCPDCITEEDTGVISVDSDNIFWHMVNAIKDLKALNDTQAATITALTARITALENK